MGSTNTFLRHYLSIKKGFLNILEWARYFLFHFGDPRPYKFKKKNKNKFKQNLKKNTHANKSRRRLSKTRINKSFQ